MWYTVQLGDSLYIISRKFGVTVEQLKQTNQLTGNEIFIGQRLFIPIASQPFDYRARPGDSLFSIAERFNTTVGSIVAANNLNTTELLIGQRLIIPVYIDVIVNTSTASVRNGPGTGYPELARIIRGGRLPVLDYSRGWYRVRLFNGREGWVAQTIVTRFNYGGGKPVGGIFGFYTLEEGPGLPSSFTSFINNAQRLSIVGLFMFRISRANPTQIEKFGSFTDRDVENLVAIAHRNNVKIVPVVHNLLYERGNPTISKDVVKRLVATPANRRTFAANLIRLIERYNFDGINIDIEDVYIEDSDRLSSLYIEIGNALRPRGYFYSTSVPSRVSDQPTNPFSAPFNYSVIGSVVDKFVVMLYNEHGWPGSGPGPVVSSGWMEKVLNYTITKMPREKIIAAVSVFGFDFNVTTGRNSYVTYDTAVELARTYNRQIIFDQESQTPMFSYNDAQGNYHEVWFENSSSILAKIQLAYRLGISGVALWRLGMEDPNLWPTIAGNVVVIKY